MKKYNIRNIFNNILETVNIENIEVIKDHPLNSVIEANPTLNYIKSILCYHLFSKKDNNYKINYKVIKKQKSKNIKFKKKSKPVSKLRFQFRENTFKKFNVVTPVNNKIKKNKKPHFNKVMYTNIFKSKWLNNIKLKKRKLFFKKRHIFNISCPNSFYNYQSDKNINKIYKPKLKKLNSTRTVMKIKLTKFRIKAKKLLLFNFKTPKDIKKFKALEKKLYHTNKFLNNIIRWKKNQRRHFLGKKRFYKTITKRGNMYIDKKLTRLLKFKKRKNFIPLHITKKDLQLKKKNNIEILSPYKKIT